MTYKEFIDNILKTRGRFACGDEYHERHHIVPKCMGGTNDEENLIDLFAREHFEAHRLLALENLDVHELIYAWWMMNNMNHSKQRDYKIAAEEYEEARIAYSEMLKSEEIKKKKSNIMSSTMKEYYSNPENHPNYGKHLSKTTKEKIGKARKGKCHSEETKRRISEIQKGQKRGPLPETTKEKIRVANTGYKHSKQAREKISKSKTGKSNNQERPIWCVETQTLYVSLKEAEQITGIWHSNISKVCSNKGLKTTGGYHWKYVYDHIWRDGTVIPGAITLGLITEEEALQILKNKKMKG